MALAAQLDAATKAYYLPQMNQIFKDQKVLKRLTGSSKKVGSGEPIKIPLIYNQESGATSYLRTDTLPIVENPVLTENHYHWSLYTASNKLNIVSMMFNTGAEAVVNLLSATMETIKEDLQATMAHDLFHVHATDALCGSNMYAITDYLDYSTHAIIGDIDRSAADGAFFRSNLSTSAGALSYDMMANMMNDCLIYGKTFPTTIITTQAIWEKYWANTFNKVGMMNSQQAINDTAVKFWGADVIWDENVPSGEMYFINPKHMYLVNHPKDNFTWSGWEDVTKTKDRREYEGRIFWTGQLICDKPMSCGLIQGITVA
jgi:hypothetical protein